EGLKLNADFYYDALTLDPYEIAANYDRNVNIVHGDADITASCECSVRYKEIFAERANLLIVQGADHRFKTLEYRSTRIDSAVEFLTAELG
ncbi:MAG: alpha/beta hydrolase, partial [Bacteroidaceae bacterium]|nr:alpha/beta hydrolase [Bacteroidaceae bacterium]